MGHSPKTCQWFSRAAEVRASEKAGDNGISPPDGIVSGMYLSATGVCNSVGQQGKIQSDVSSQQKILNNGSAVGPITAQRNPRPARPHTGDHGTVFKFFVRAISNSASSYDTASAAGSIEKYGDF